MIYEVNLRFETRKKIGPRPENEKSENEKLNSRFTLITPLEETTFIFWEILKVAQLDVKAFKAYEITLSCM